MALAAELAHATQVTGLAAVALLPVADDVVVGGCDELAVTRPAGDSDLAGVAADERSASAEDGYWGGGWAGEGGRGEGLRGGGGEGCGGGVGEVCALGPGGAHVALVEGEEHGAAAGAADGEHLRGAAVGAGRSDSALHVERVCAEHVVAEAVEGTKALGTGRATLAGVVGEFGGVAEDEMGNGEGVDGAVSADGVEASGVGAESQ